MRARRVVLIVIGVAAVAIAGCGRDNTDPAAMTAFATDLVDAINSRDPATLRELACSNATDSTAVAIRDAAVVEGARLINVGEAASGTTKVRVALTGGGGVVTPYDLVVDLTGDRPCWHDIVAIEGEATPDPDVGQG